MNHRRLVLKSVGVTALAVPLAALAQTPAKIWRVGILPGGLLAPRKFLWDAFRERMHQLGYVEGKNVVYEFRPPAMEGAPYDDLAADLVRLNVDLIVATSGAAIAAAKKATLSIPIVMCPVTDAVGLGLIASLARPGGNLTGIEVQFEETTGKRLQLLREMVPKAARIAFLYHGIGKKQREEAELAARQLGVRLQSLEVDSAQALPGAFEAAVKERAEALMVAQVPFTFGLRAQITALALQHRLPSMYAQPSNADAGGLMSYGPNDIDYYRQAARFVDKIFKGAKPADLPVEQPTRWELVLNMKTAKALGLTVPPLVLLQATRLIE